MEIDWWWWWFPGLESIHEVFLAVIHDYKWNVCDTPSNLCFSKMDCSLWWKLSQQLGKYMKISWQQNKYMLKTCNIRYSNCTKKLIMLKRGI